MTRRPLEDHFSATVIKLLLFLCPKCVCFASLGSSQGSLSFGSLVLSISRTDRSLEAKPRSMVSGLWALRRLMASDHWSDHSLLMQWTNPKPNRVIPSAILRWILNFQLAFVIISTKLIYRFALRLRIESERRLQWRLQWISFQSLALFLRMQ